MYFLVINNEQAGPYSMDELKKLIKEGTLTKQTYVWKDGMDNWQFASQVDEVNRLFMPTPPPIPGSGIPPLPHTSSTYVDLLGGGSSDDDVQDDEEELLSKGTIESIAVPEDIDTEYLDFSNCPNLKEIHIASLGVLQKLTGDEDKRLKVYVSDFHDDDIDYFVDFAQYTDEDVFKDIECLYLPDQSVIDDLMDFCGGNALLDYHNKPKARLDVLPDNYIFPDEQTETFEDLFDGDDIRERMDDDEDEW